MTHPAPSAISIIDSRGDTKRFTPKDALRHAVAFAAEGEVILKKLPDRAYLQDVEVALREAAVYFDAAKFYLELANTLAKGI